MSATAPREIEVKLRMESVESLLEAGLKLQAQHCEKLGKPLEDMMF